MNVGDWTNVIVGVATIYFFWQQNRIFERQNEIFAEQAGLAMSSTNGKLLGLKRYWPMLAMAGLTLCTWGAVAYDVYNRHSVSIPEFDTPQAYYTLMGYGVSSDGRSCFGRPDGKSLLSRRSNYRMAIACFVVDDQLDLLDTPDLQMSNTYEITPGGTLMLVICTDDFLRRRNERHLYAMYIAFLNIPNNVKPSQFSTLRQARALGVKIQDVRLVNLHGGGGFDMK